MDLGPNVASENKPRGAGVDDSKGKGQIYNLAFCVGFSGRLLGSSAGFSKWTKYAKERQIKTMQRIFVTNKRTYNVIIGVRLFNPAAQQRPRVLPVSQGPRQKNKVKGLEISNTVP